jgi:methionyl-tRNA synthetase
VPRVGDTDFTIDRLIARSIDELANGLGNLINRVVAMIHRYRDGHVPATEGTAPGAEDLATACRQASDLIHVALTGFDFRRATAAVWAIVDEANRFINQVRPWELAKDEYEGSARATEQLDVVLAVLIQACRTLGDHLTLFLPDTAARVTRQCTTQDGRLPEPRPLFRRITIPKPRSTSVPQHDNLKSDR